MTKDQSTSALDRQLKKSLRANLLMLGDAALRYVVEEAEREIKRRRLQVRERRRSASLNPPAPSPVQTGRQP